jgi:hypothetical protein
MLFNSTVLHDLAHLDELKSLVGVVSAKYEINGNSPSGTVQDLLNSRKLHDSLSGSPAISPISQMRTVCEKYGLGKSLERLNIELGDIRRRNYPLYTRSGTMMH